MGINQDIENDVNTIKDARSLSDLNNCLVVTC